MEIDSSVARDVAERKDRWTGLAEEGADPGFLFFVSYEDAEADIPPQPRFWPDKVQERIEWAWGMYQDMVRRAAFLKDDRVPYLSNLTGTEIFAEAFGCKVHRPDDTNPFALPFIHTAAEADALRVPELSSSSLAYLFDIADELHRRGGPAAALRLVDIQSPMDIAALIWDKSDLFVAMLETPEAVKALAAKVGELLTAFLDEWFARYGTEYVAHFPDYFMSGGMTLSEDEIGAVNEDMFDEFFRDELEALSARYGGIGIHCCADARHQWANLKSLPGLRVLNLCRPPTRTEAYARDALDFFGNDVLHQHHGWNPQGEPESWPEQVPASCRYVLTLSAEGRDEAVALCDRLNAVRSV